MGGLSIWHWLVVGVIILLLFGKGRFSEMMGDVAKGLKSFKKGMSEDEEAAAARTAEPPRRLTDEASVAPPRRVGDEPIVVPPAERGRETDLGERREP